MKYRNNGILSEGKNLYLSRRDSSVAEIRSLRVTKNAYDEL
jgi:hypothetical protein